MKEIFKKYIDICLFILMLLFAAIVVINKESLNLGSTYGFTSVNAAFIGDSGKIYSIDEGREAVCIIDTDNSVSRILRGGNSKGFFYAEGIAEGSDDTLYILDESYFGDLVSDALSGHRIISFKNNKYTVLYDSGIQRIYDLQYYEDSLHFLREEEYGLGLYELKDDGEAVLRKRIYAGDVLNDASYDLSTGLVAIATKRGAVRVQKSAFSTWFTLNSEGRHIMPRAVTARNGYVYFSELYSGSICGFSGSNVEKYYELFRAKGLKINRLNGDYNSGTILASDLNSFYTFTADGEGKLSEPVYRTSLTYKGFPKTIALWVLLVLAILLFLYFMRFLPKFVFNLINNESALRMVAVIVAVITVSGFISSSLLSDERIKEDERDVTEMKLFSDVMLDYLDQSSLSKIEWEYDYLGSAYMKFRDSLDIPFTEAEKLGKNYFYTFYRLNDGTTRYLLNYADTVMCGEPCGKTDDRYVRDCFYNGNSYAVKSRDSEGTWLMVLQPVIDDKGKTVAVMEVGTDLNFREQERSRKTWDTIVNVFCSSAVMMMLIIEALFLITFYEKKIKGREKTTDVTHSIPLRTVMTLTYLASAMQDPFITMLAARIYQGELLIPREMATGLPLTIQFLMMALLSALTGHLSEKTDSKKLLYAGLFTNIAGLVICTVFCEKYLGILCGNMLIGAGVGILLVTSNAIAAKGETMESTADAFAGVMAGILSGFTMGAGLSALIYPVGGGRMSYLVAACFMVPVFFLIRYSDNIAPGKQEAEEKNEEISFYKFFFNPRVLGFFVFILIPFMTSISYREYFFPLYAMMHGVDEVRVGQIFLLCGLMVIYVGPHISSAIIKRFGTFWSVVIASVTMGLNLIVVALRPSMFMVVLGVVILSVVISFAYTCQYTYFESLPDSLMYGDGKAMGVYSVFENMGQTIGPVVYGALLLLGERKGIGIFGVLMLVFCLMYVFAMGRGRRFFK
ncbi:MAG: MFS transporter [Lachnospiraceae bacterium]|nr:MFS transporter [Lachnospiraceae bacterium]